MFMLSVFTAGRALQRPWAGARNQSQLRLAPITPSYDPGLFSIPDFRARRAATLPSEKDQPSGGIACFSNERQYPRYGRQSVDFAQDG